MDVSEPAWLTEEQKSYLRGKQYEAEKMAQGGTGANQYTAEQSGQNVQSASRRETKDGTAASSTANYAKRTGDRGAPGSQIISATCQKCKADNS